MGDQPSQITEWSSAPADGAPEATFKRVLYIREVNAIHPTFAKKLGLWIRPIA